MYSSYSTRSSSPFASMGSSSNGVWMIIALVIAIIGGILLYFLFTNKKNDGKFSGFVAWLHSFLRFDKMMIEALTKIAYLILALYVTLSSFAFISVNFLTFILYLVLGNIIVRIIFEFSLLGIQLWKNTTEINSKLPDKKKEEK